MDQSEWPVVDDARTTPGWAPSYRKRLDMNQKKHKRSATDLQRRPSPAAIIVVTVVAAGAVFVGWKAFAPQSRDITIEVAVPKLSPIASAGKAAFDANCGQCHGRNAAGTGKGPPLVHDIYNPGHHADAAFFSATRRGVQQHHWPFGNMPAQSQVSDEEIAAIVRYVRELQSANGIAYRPHRM
jgi:mono/diheme cytochrome c family protein